ncbi:MAG: hypothetical protein NTU48_02185 [Legionellales bacterium]|jgi:hypothetical protein|nr:hypothetical protein [Legionellales bacterium]
MAYDYHGVPEFLTKKSDWFAPQNTVTPNEWTGAVKIFNPKAMNAICSYNEKNIQLTGSSPNLERKYQ